ncbi:hypothetical protein H310_13912 [Aphanomyces invadans]|uniref:Phosphoenolpyruvate carboxykinase (ATP) n=1 Tax=Aphanomyces invadans TaxID=157072 RepID=A0A024TBJ6_9STRA|nr:hypothetical protein H310_13912 [Aphanomyces invadans]ETV91530.1 hypothetical protein H310_13912 [Aphanomyces invadans]|eukprot:XP_008879798.1 hypothetical protein H310_13912 [Aphanomyces invadans]
MQAAAVLRRAAVAAASRSTRIAAVRAMSSTPPPTPSFASQLEPEIKVPRHFIGAFPEETEANNFEVNWSLADDDITPLHNCYRNRELGNLAAAAAIAAPVPNAASPAVAAENWSTGKFLDLWNDVTNQLSHSPDMYISDGAIGAHATLRTPIRVVSDTPRLAHALANLLTKVPTLKDPHTPRPVLVVWKSSKDKDQSAFVYNIDTNVDGFTQAKLVVRGDGVSLDSLLQNVLSLKAELDGAVDTGAPATIAAEVVAADGKSTLVFGANAAFRGSQQASLSAAHGVVWDPAVGVTPAFQGVVVPPAAVRVSKASSRRHQAYPASWSSEASVVGHAFPTLLPHPTHAVAYGAPADKTSVSVEEFVKQVNGSAALAAALTQHGTALSFKK